MNLAAFSLRLASMELEILADLLLRGLYRQYKNTVAANFAGIDFRGILKHA